MRPPRPASRLPGTRLGHGTTVIVVCGEALVDLIPDADRWRAAPGGSPANVAVGLGRLGHPTALLARLADDAFGRLLRDHLDRSGVELSLAVASRLPTTLAVVDLDPAGVADYSFYVDGAADGGWSPADLPILPAAADAVMVSGSLALAVPSFDETVHDLLVRESRIRTIVVDPNVRLSLVRDRADHQRRLDRWLSLADVVKVSDADIAELQPGTDPIAVATNWLTRGPRVVVVTRGAAGATAVMGSDRITVAGRPVHVVDTVGAGDSFTAGLLTALADLGRLAKAALPLLSVGELERCVTYACEAAAVTCTRAGAQPPSQQEMAGARMQLFGDMTPPLM